MSNDIVLSVRNLTKIFPAKIPFVALDHLSFDLHEGEILGLLGPNGAGKTTTIQMLLSTLKPTSGEIVYFGKNFFTNRSEILAQVAFASTYIKFPDKLTIRENLDVYGRLYGLTANERKHRIEKFLKFFGVWNQLDKPMSAISAGQTTRHVGKSIHGASTCALLDEPTASWIPTCFEFVRL